MGILVKAMAKGMNKCKQIQINIKMAELGSEFDVKKGRG